ncbi:4-hydroxybenzoate polyprenyltransferase, mitochondrial [Capsicum annuum]|nr:4-hydroxybenzoate polyprenyltransferase, mitochondrial [Capsicum annuum]
MALYRRLSQTRHVYRRRCIAALYPSGDLTNPSHTVPYSPSINLFQFSSSGKSLTFYTSHPSKIELSGFRQLLHFSTLANSEENKKNEQQTPSASPSPSWIDTYLPRIVRPYAHLARLDKPIGTWLLAWPCMWSIALAAPPGSLPDVKMMTLFGCGALLLRGAGCTINDLLDRDIDTKVERTRSRPVASGVLTPFQGLTFLGFQLLLGLGILLQLNNYREWLSVLTEEIYMISFHLLVYGESHFGSFVPVAGLLIPPHEEIYILGNPQAFLGLTFNWGALLGWAAIKGSIDPSVVLPLYASGVFWTLVYDTIYAHQDKEDDLKVGVKSTALRFGDSTKEWISGFGLACISSLALSGVNADIGWPYYAFLTAASGQLAWQIWTVDLSSRADCNRKGRTSLANSTGGRWFPLPLLGFFFGRNVRQMLSPFSSPISYLSSIKVSS